MRRQTATIVAATTLVLAACGGSSSTDAADTATTSAAPTTQGSTGEAIPSTTTVPPTTAAPTTEAVPADVQACIDSVWSVGISDAGVDPWSSYSGGGQTTNCVIIDDAGEDWVVLVTFGGLEWTNDQMLELFDAEWNPVALRVEYTDDDGEWFVQHPGSCFTQNGQQVCTPANPRAEVADTRLVCGGRSFVVNRYTAEGSASERRTSSDEYRAIQAEVFAKVCPTYPVS